MTLCYLVRLDILATIAAMTTPIKSTNVSLPHIETAESSTRQPHGLLAEPEQGLSLRNVQARAKFALSPRQNRPQSLPILTMGGESSAVTRDLMPEFSDCTTPVRSPTNRYTFQASHTLASFCLSDAAIKLLTKEMARPDLAALASQFEAKFSGRWAFTGSIALWLHSTTLKQAPNRAPADANLELMEMEFDSLLSAVEKSDDTGAMKRAIGDNGQPEKFLRFDDKVDVNLIKLRDSKLSGQGHWENVHGIPVVTLAKLKSFKKMDVRNYDSNIANKAKDDLAHIETLLEVQKINHRNANAEPANLDAAQSEQVVSRAARRLFS